jgi:hypothetical protein
MRRLAPRRQPTEKGRRMKETVETIRARIERDAEWRRLGILRSIHDRQAAYRALLIQHQLKRAAAAARGLLAPTEADLTQAAFRDTKRYLRFIGATSKYQPHQGRRECERRRARGLKTRPDSTLTERQTDG